MICRKWNACFGRLRRAEILELLPAVLDRLDRRPQIRQLLVVQPLPKEHGGTGKLRDAAVSLEQDPVALLGIELDGHGGELRQCAPELLLEKCLHLPRQRRRAIDLLQARAQSCELPDRQQHWQSTGEHRADQH